MRKYDMAPMLRCQKRLSGLIDDWWWCTCFPLLRGPVQRPETAQTQHVRTRARQLEASDCVDHHPADRQGIHRPQVHTHIVVAADLHLQSWCCVRVVYPCPRPSTSRVGPLERIASLLSCVYASTTGKPWDQSAPRTFARTRTDCMYFRITPHANLARTQAQRPQAGRMSPPPALRLPQWVPSPAPEPLPPSCVRLWTSRRRSRPRPRPRSRRRARLPLKVCVTGTSSEDGRTKNNLLADWSRSVV